MRSRIKVEVKPSEVLRVKKHARQAIEILTFAKKLQENPKDEALLATFVERVLTPMVGIRVKESKLAAKYLDVAESIKLLEDTLLKIRGKLLSDCVMSGVNAFRASKTTILRVVESSTASFDKSTLAGYELIAYEALRKKVKRLRPNVKLEKA